MLQQQYALVFGAIPDVPEGKPTQTLQHFYHLTQNKAAKENLIIFRVPVRPFVNSLLLFPPHTQPSQPLMLIEVGYFLHVLFTFTISVKRTAFEHVLL